MNLLRWAASALLIPLLCSCSTSPFAGAPRFREAANADVIVRAPNLDLINIVRPDTKDNGFITLHAQAEAEQILAQARIQHNLAVVVCSRFNTDERDAEYQQAWIAIFRSLHFQRVVFLRAAWSQEIDGLAVIVDVRLAGGPLAKQG